MNKNVISQMVDLTYEELKKELEFEN